MQYIKKNWHRELGIIIKSSRKKTILMKKDDKDLYLYKNH